ncbi:MAG: CRISPR-associated helicase Cas3' [Burkholderiaceae bacterium]|nr:CRISPR-associated helicase Cas3' [Burkholderiaceae bacterium]
MRSYWHYWGKATRSESTPALLHLLPYHCLDVAAVGSAYLAGAPKLRSWLAAEFGIASEDDLVAWLAFWLCLHDLGKYSEAFQGQRADLFARLRGRAPRLPYNERHDTLGSVAWRELLEQPAVDEGWMGPRTEDLLQGLDAWVRAVTGHHGQPPKSDRIYFGHHFDVAHDSVSIVDFVQDTKALLLRGRQPLLRTTLEADDFCEASQRLSWWIAGLAVLADWIGSNTDYYRYHDQPPANGQLDHYWQYARRQAVIALAATGVLPGKPPVHAPLTTLFPAITHPSPLQAWASDTPIAPEPSLVMLEDVTGAGKTEAAVLLAHRFMAAGMAEGFFIGLPTMATANAMYGRIAEVFQRLFGDEASLALAHGQRSLVETFATTVLRAGPVERDRTQHDETASARCTAWLADHNKRALMAAAGVGTIDQAMLGVLHSKHQSLRLLGLFRKVLIIDEVHACDSYMQRVLESLLEFHAFSGGSAILLSATLPQAMKQALLAAYVRGRGFARGDRSPPQPALSARDFPLATTWHAAMAMHVREQPLASRTQVCRNLALRYLPDRQGVDETIEAALATGRCVCWIRNTVADAAAAFEAWRARIEDDRLSLFHARFALADRLAIETSILQRFGKDSTAEQRRGQLVIATQVVEQSLDADWDVIVSDLAPIDRLIQRAGRLQRHARDSDGNRLRDDGAADRRGEPCLWVHAPAWTERPPANWYKAAFPNGAAVYPNHAHLWLTARALQAGRLRMPEDARDWIESVFGEGSNAPAQLAANATQAEGNNLAARSQGCANVVKLSGGYARGDVVDWWSEARTPSRLGEASTTVVLARWDGDLLRPWVAHDKPAAAWAYSSVRVPERLISTRCAGSSPAREAALVEAETLMPGAGKWSVLLPLEQGSDNLWRGRALTAERKHRPASGCDWTYSASGGLMPAKDDEQEGGE